MSTDTSCSSDIIVSAFAKHLTNFTLTDATDLEDKECDIDQKLKSKVEAYIYGLLSRIFKGGLWCVVIFVPVADVLMS
jgi:hypothetical protein